MFRSLPLFILPLIIYNLLLFTGDINVTLAAELIAFDLMSGAHWVFTAQDAFIVGGVLVLYFEIIKATGTGMSSILDHTFSMLIFVVYLIEFLLVKGAGTTAFFVLTLMALLDVISGFTVSIVSARRDFAFDGTR